MHIILFEKIHKKLVAMLTSGKGGSVAVGRGHEGDLLTPTHLWAHHEFEPCLYITYTHTHRE